MLVNKVAKLLNVGPDTVRFYTRAKLLNPEKNRFNGYREYSQKDVKRLKFVLTARQLGFSIDDIQQILADADKKRSPCPQVRHLLEKRLQETEELFQEMQQLRERMQKALAIWQRMPDMEPTGEMICHLIEEFTIPLKLEEK